MKLGDRGGQVRFQSWVACSVYSTQTSHFRPFSSFLYSFNFFHALIVPIFLFEFLVIYFILSIFRFLSSLRSVFPSFPYLCPHVQCLFTFPCLLPSFLLAAFLIISRIHFFILWSLHTQPLRRPLLGNTLQQAQ